MDSAKDMVTFSLISDLAESFQSQSASKQRHNMQGRLTIAHQKCCNSSIIIWKAILISTTMTHTVLSNHANSSKNKTINLKTKGLVRTIFVDSKMMFGLSLTSYSCNQNLLFLSCLLQEGSHLISYRCIQM